MTVNMFATVFWQKRRYENNVARQILPFDNDSLASKTDSETHTFTHDVCTFERRGI